MNATALDAPLVHDCWWGELISGTEQQIKRLGIGQALHFPSSSDAGGTRELQTVDPRGFPVRIKHHTGEKFLVSIRYPGREEQPSQQIERRQFAMGVALIQYPHCDNYIGTGQALVAAGIVELRHLPGQPGMRKVAVTIHHDGSIAGGAPTAPNSLARKPGARRISRKGKTKYCVSIFVSEEERERRRRTYDQTEREFMQRMWALPRPAPLSATMTIGERFERYAGAPMPARALPPTWRLIVNPNPPRA